MSLITFLCGTTFVSFKPKADLKVVGDKIFVYYPVLMVMSIILYSPEYAYTLKVDEKSDVYSFGVVLLELVSGKKPVGEFGDGVDIVQWVRMLTDGNKEEVSKILDSRLSTVALHEVMHVFYVGLLCVQEHAMERPTMREVVQILTELPRPPNSKQGDAMDTNSALESPSSTTKEQHHQSPRSPSADLLSI